MIAAAAAFACVLQLLVAATAAVTRHPLLLVVSFDGFRTDYVRPDLTPNLARFRDAGASPPYMRNAFPTKTFVNHFTMATGLHPETHGVLDNYMFDRHNETMHYTYEQFHYDEAVVPIWMQNEYNGDGRYSGVMMWSGSEFPYQGKTSTYVQKYNKSMPWTSRIDKIFSWIKNDKKPANLVMAYFEEPDNTGHEKGVESQEVKDQIVRVDVTVKYILDKIKYEHLEDKINLIILSDHGMESVTYDRMIFLDKYVSNKTHKIISTGPNAFVNPIPGKFDEVYSNLTKGAAASGTFDVYKQDQLLDRWHMKNTPRLKGLIYLLAKPKYAIWDEYFQQMLSKTTPAAFLIGTHGYDNEEPAMRAIFMASGPAFKNNFTARPFDNVDLYPLVSYLMSLDEPAVRPNGTMAGVQQLLLRSSSGASAATPLVRLGTLATVTAFLHACVASRP